MAAKAFVDTSILLRAMIPGLSRHSEAESLIQHMWENNTDLWISRQVLREYLVQATHPNSFSPPLTIEQVIRQIEIIRTLFRVADETGLVTDHLLTLLQNHATRGKQVHDANLVATMLANEVDILLTLNVKDFKRFGDKIEIISLEEMP